VSASGTSLTTKEIILRSAIEVLNREGIEALTTRRVAKEAGVNLGLLHYYFESKEALVREALLHFISGQTEDFLNLPQEDGKSDPLDELIAIFSMIQERAFGKPGIVFYMLRLLLGQVAKAAAEGKSEAEIIQHGEVPAGPMFKILGFIATRVKMVVVAALGSNEELVGRRSIQIFTSLFHPLLFTPFPKAIFGCDLSTPEGRSAYVRGVITDALKPPDN